MTDPPTRKEADDGEPEGPHASLSRRALLGVVVALWSTGSLSDRRVARLLYGLQGYGQFRYGGETERDEESVTPD